ncbi:ThiF family protein [Brugia malayi]|uniref:NEDD8-activating enzyme E1 regulatory subunit n=2 Tax=Brugia malayi TaxID=6279 RepID=A0A0J9Y941_BRUMA|nr:ThiF family protein [Brugia malayi]CDQ04817.1 BMA-ULA-1, isoform c [Brugia malayi]VIO90515.1 ThiF family protein [Brugia malayi]
MEDDARYDRQIRLWGDEGQSCIEHASVCVLSASALGCEIIKSLVLAGIRSVYIIDSAVVRKPDLGNNFFVDEIDEPRAKAALRLLTELNPAVEGDFDIGNPEDIITKDTNFLRQFTVIVGCNLNIDVAARINDFLFGKNIPFVHARAYGFVGFVRISVQEHTIIDTHEENISPDLRLDCPFPALSELVESVDLNQMHYDAHSHTPYLILFLKTLELWREQYSQDDFPDNREKRKTFETIFMSLRMPHPENGSYREENFVEGHAAMVRSLKRTTIPLEVKELLDHPKARRPDLTQFWLLTAALRRFVIANEVLPVQGSLPDMISDSESYVLLATKFRDKAKQDAKEVMGYLQQFLVEQGVPTDIINFNDCEFFCKKAAYLRVQHGTTIAQEMKSSLKEVFDDIRNANFAPSPITGVPQIPPAVWYILLRAIDRFHSEKSRFPGTNGVPCTIDAYDLKARVVDLVMETELEDKSEMIERIPPIAIDEMCRYGASELHVIASLVGGITAQEVIKLITHQYIPLDNTFIFDGHTQRAQTYRL